MPSCEEKKNGRLRLPESCVCCAGGWLGVLLHVVLRKHITCNAVARRGWLRAEKAAVAWNVGMGYVDVKLQTRNGIL